MSSVDAKTNEIVDTGINSSKSQSIDTTNNDYEQKEELSNEKLNEGLKKEQNKTLHAGKNEFNIDLSYVTKHIASYGINIFSEGIEFTKQILQKQQQINCSNKDIDQTYEIIDDDVKNIIFTDRNHSDGQIFLMKSDTRIQQRIIGFLIKIGIELPIHNWTWFDILITGVLKCGTIKLINYIDRDLIGKILLGMCWVIPPFIEHFFDKNINKFTSNIVIQMHSFVCLLMILFAICDIVTSLNKYDWKKSVLFSLILIIFSAFYYLLFYSQNIFNTLLCVILIPFCWKFIQLKGQLTNENIQKYVLYKNKDKLTEIYNNLYANELYINESVYVINRVYDITQNVVKKKKKRKCCAICALLLLWTCFVLKLYGHINYLYGEYKIEWRDVSLNGYNGIADNVNEYVCSNNDILCNWIINEIQLSQYLDTFREHGFETMDLICSLNENNLKSMQIYKQAHINSFIKYTKSKPCWMLCENQTCQVAH